MDDEKTWMISKLDGYKNSIIKREKSLIKELARYQEKSNPDMDLGKFKDIRYDIYNNPHETYLIAQIKITSLLPSVLDRHIFCIKKGTNLDLVLKSLELEIYKIKKKVYVNIKEWENLLNHLSDYRILEIENNPKGPGDLLIKDLLWIREYENKQKNLMDDK
ncbi:MAG TPA: hypothetical protein VMC48_03040 [Methanobacterium sp.]|nr:hypothetical protein [Methanobacterium sp.]